MKRIYQFFTFALVAGLMTMFTVNNADAQRGGGNRGGGGGGGFHGGGGNGGGGSRGGGGFSGGGNRGGGGFSGGNRGGGQVQSAPRTNSFGGGVQGGNRSYAPRTNSFSGSNRGGFAYGNRGGVATRSYGGVRSNGYYRPGAGYAYGNRGGFRGSVGIGFGNRGGFRGGFYNHSGFYGRYYAPRLGFSLGILPFGYYPFYYGPDQYFYSGGYYYQYDNNQYTVVEPPVGAEINSLPSNAQAINIDGQQYYEANGVYYLPITRDDGSTAYQIAGKDGQLQTGAGQDQYQGDPNYQQNGNYAPQGNNQDMLQPGEVVQALPPDTRKVKIDNQVYHVDPAGVYYHEERDQNGQKVYRVTDMSQTPN